MFLIAPGIFAQTPSELNRSGVNRAKRGDYAESMKDFDEAIRKVNASSARAYHNLGWTSEQKGRDAEALKYYEQAIERNPQQIPSLERAGELYYDAGKYDAAIVMGERVLALEPLNKAVLPWLEKAYQARFRVKGMEITAKEREELRNKAEENMKKPDQPAAEKPRLVTVGVSIGGRWLYRNGDSAIKYAETEGLFGISMPVWFHAVVTPNDTWSVNAGGGVPYYGALMPAVINFHEFIEASYRNGSVILGAGLMGHHLRNDVAFGEKLELNDYKVGLVLGLRKEKSTLDVRFYPALIPYDAGYEPNKSFDATLLDIRYYRMMTSTTELSFRFDSRGFTFYDHGAEYSNYAGYYEAGLGLRHRPSPRIQLEAEFSEKYYMLDVYNDKPYQVFNGQGYFGINMAKWFKGDPLSGYYALGHVISGTVREKIGTHVDLYQKLRIEIVPPSRERNELFFEVGAAAGF